MKIILKSLIKLNYYNIIIFIKSKKFKKQKQIKNQIDKFKKIKCEGDKYV